MAGARSLMEAGRPSLALARDERAMPTQTALGADAKTGRGTDRRNGPFVRYHPGGIFLHLLLACSAAMNLHGKVAEVAREPSLRVGRGQFVDVTFRLLERCCR